MIISSGSGSRPSDKRPPPNRTIDNGHTCRLCVVVHLAQKYLKSETVHITRSGGASIYRALPACLTTYPSANLPAHMSTLPYSARTRFDRSPHMCVFSSTFPSGIGKTLSFSTRFVYKYALLHFRQTTRRTTPPHPIDTIHPRSIDRSPIELSSSWSPSAKQFTRQIHSSERFVCHPQLQLARCHLSTEQL